MATTAAGESRTKSTDTLMQAIDERLKKLERLVSPSTLHANVVVPKDNPEATIIGGLKNAERSLKRELHSNQTLQTFFELYEEAEQLLVSRQAMPGTVVPPQMDVGVLREIVLAADQEMIEAAVRLREVEVLKRELDIPVLKDLSQLENRLAHIEAVERPSIEAIMQAHDRFQTSLAEYNQFILSVSELFVHFHYMLSDIEAEMDEAQNDANEE
eukprot:jgi/Hompol1/5909/HPOL_002686-RA